VAGIEKRPIYGNIFEYIDDQYDFVSSDNVLTRFYKRDIREFQYPHLDGPVNEERTGFNNTEEAARVVAEFSKSAGADLVGFTEVKDGFVFEGTEIEHKFAVVLAMEMDFELIGKSPALESGVEVLRVYWKLGIVALKVAEFIRSLGYPARVHHPRGWIGANPTVLHTLAAIEAGLGEEGRHGLLMTEEFGPRVRIATVTTDLELPQAEKKSFGIDEFCKKCHLCQIACEGDAIPEEKKEERGVLKYTIDPYKCAPYFAKYDGCNLCVAKCVFNRRPENLQRLVSSLKERM
jgi:hypothetical protein